MAKKNFKKDTKRLTLKNKMEIIEYKKIHKDVSDTRIAEIFSLKFGIDIQRRSIKNFMDKEKEIKDAFVTNNYISNIPRNIKYADLDKKLKDWIDIIETGGGFFTDLILKTKALEIHKELNKNNEFIHTTNEFKASNGWLHRFKKRYRISSKQCYGESLLVNKQCFEDFFLIIREKIVSYGENNVFNCDETDFYTN
ncbi:CENP-B like protein 2 [Dictyocoela muelleri]|nr:CENP-B like protein 2 [Dictyocoela muelleri]